MAQATCPYLRQRAGKPADWWPWEPGADGKARRRAVPSS
ncbi:hypothetical protein ABZ532_08150 [Streptomyces sp. NPDC019396]